MKPKFILFTLSAFLSISLTLKGQNPVYAKPDSRNIIPFDQKLPAPAVRKEQKNINAAGNRATITTYKELQDANFSRAKRNTTGVPAMANKTFAIDGANEKNLPSNFHLTKDINTSSPGGSPNNWIQATTTPSFAIFNNITYFNADDGIHGAELWRSDGTTNGTYMVKDINPGGTGSGLNWVFNGNGKLYFNAYTDANGWEFWISDGTAANTKPFRDANGGRLNYVGDFVKVNNTVFFTTNSEFGSAVWKTDGTPTGTKLLYDFNATDEYAGYVTEPMTARGLYFFSAWTPADGRELWRSDGTVAGTFMVKDIGPDQSDYYSPLQLTEYNNKLYFSGDDGSGRRLWCSNGTAAGTFPVLNNNNVFTHNDYVTFINNTQFAVLNHILYFSGFTNTDGSGLYKYDASANTGVALVKDLTPGPEVDYIPAPELKTVGDILFFKVINSIGDYHDELWTSKGKASNTKLVKLFEPGQITFNYYDIHGELYFTETEPALGAELWKSNGTLAGTKLIKDIYKGYPGANPLFLTPFNGKILFSADNVKSGPELWSSNGSEHSTELVKDINTAFTWGSDAGTYGMAALGNSIIFSAYESDHGVESYKSDGTNSGTMLLKDIQEGEFGSFPYNFLSKNNQTYFSAYTSVGSAIFKTNGTTNGTRKIIDIDGSNYFLLRFVVSDNNIVFYTLYNFTTGEYELWRNNGNPGGNYLLTSGLYFEDPPLVVGNIVFFTAGNAVTGYELWKSNGTVAGTKLVKDINPGIDGSFPYKMFGYKGDVYFGAFDGAGYTSFWKSDGTSSGTLKLRDLILPPLINIFCVSNNILYFSATDYNAVPYQGIELWKTNGTPQGTKLVKDICPNFDSYPVNLTDVNGTLFFSANDDFNGTELWSSNGTAAGTRMVKDIYSDYPGMGSYPFSLCAANNKLYFLIYGAIGGELWESDGTANGTKAVEDAGLTGLVNIQPVTVVNDKLFFPAYSYKYGIELFTNANDEDCDKIISNSTAKQIVPEEAAPVKSDVRVYPNPATNTLNITIPSSGNNKITNLSVTGIDGRIYITQIVNAKTIVQLDVSHLPAGTYFVKLTGGQNDKNPVQKFIKQ